MTRTALRLLVALSVPLLWWTVAGPPAGAASKVGPDQYFTGVINGTDGNTVIPVPVRMGCFGPVTPGQTGHPLAGQTLAVHQLFPPAPATTLGRTGSDTTIGVFFGAPPPAGLGGSPPLAGSTSVRFSRYDNVKALPTALTLPCSGRGTVWFVPVPVIPPSRAEAVPVHFVSQP